jgi:hypothetical protein
MTSCKRSFKKISKNRFFSHSFGKSRKKGRFDPGFVDNRRCGHGASEAWLFQGTRAIRSNSGDEKPKNRRKPTILSLPSTIGGLRELPRFRNRFRLPTTSFGAHHRRTRGRGKTAVLGKQGGGLSTSGRHSGLPGGGAIAILPLFRLADRQKVLAGKHLSSGQAPCDSI